MISAITISLYRTICQKLNEGWNAEKLSSYLGVNYKRAQVLIRKAVKYECGDHSPHTPSKTYRKEAHSL